MATSPAASLPSQVVSAASTNTNTNASTSSNTTLASNFQTFLTLLTTQLQNQNPMDPLDTNQFTQQLVQFAQVEQQLKQNDQLTKLIDIQKTTQATQALNFVGSKVVVDGTTAGLSKGTATWNLTSPKDVSATVNVMNSTGQTVYTGTYSINAGKNDFIWDGKGNDGIKWPDGDYKIQVVAKDSSGAAVTVDADSQGVVDSVDLTATPPLLSIGTKTFTVDQVKRIVSGNKA
jgi:flagellar basal-body rod modification protein FlgD